MSLAYYAFRLCFKGVRRTVNSIIKNSSYLEKTMELSSNFSKDFNATDQGYELYKSSITPFYFLFFFISICITICTVCNVVAQSVPPGQLPLLSIFTNNHQKKTVVQNQPPKSLHFHDSNSMGVIINRFLKKKCPVLRSNFS